MPSDVRGAAADTRGPAAAAHDPANTLVEPPSAKLLVRLFLIPFLIVAAAVGVMFLISLMAGRTPTAEEALARLKNPGGGRTAEYLIGPGAKQRYLDAKALTDYMKDRMAGGMPTAERVRLSNELIDILDKHTKSGEGEVRHFLLLALGRAWQADPRQPPDNTADAVAARQRAVEALLRYADEPQVATRKAALLATVYLKAHDDAVAKLLPTLSNRVRDAREDLDVRMAAATALGPLASPNDQDAIDALHQAMRDPDPHNVELVWQSALSLAQLGQPDVADTILKLLSREELAQVQVYDRERDPKNPTFRKLSEAEQERILINTIIGAENYPVPAVQERLKELARSDPSQRVRAALQAKSARDAAGDGR